MVELIESTPPPSFSKQEVVEEPQEVAIDMQNLNVWYAQKHAVENVNLKIPARKITAIIGPSGCGKSTVLRAVNRMNELIPKTRTTGNIFYQGENILSGSIDPTELRSRIGMVFQKPNPFPKSIYDNVAFGAKINGYKGDMDKWVQGCLEKAALWDEVKRDLQKSGLSLSGGQQQRLCIARALAVSPDVILMDEPCSALDPIATLKIEDLMRKLSKEYTLLLVTHNMNQASRVSDFTAYMLAEAQAGGIGPGHLIELSPTEELFKNPKDIRTEDFITGKFG